jgi:serine phosphatase RsbU (regulator of sigma subunit)
VASAALAPRPPAVTLAGAAAGAALDATAVAFLHEVAQQASVTLDTTRAMADSRRVAQAMAVGLTPPTLPRLVGARFATYYRVALEHEALGGDFYDVHGDQDDWTVVMGDVCGKGAPPRCSPARSGSGRLGR